MGREIRCRAKSGGKWVQGEALLETNEVLFRGDLRLKIPFASLDSVLARNGELYLKWPGHSAVFDLGEQAEKWAHAILHPKSTADKLGIKPGLRISAVNLPNDSVMRDAGKAAAELFARAFVPHYLQEGIQFSLSFLDELTRSIPCSIFRFAPTDSAVEAIRHVRE